jgi:type IV pilus assembly protein PilX
MKKQKGMALIVVLVLLAISLMLGLSGVQSSLIDERMAGNYKAAVRADMHAEIAAAQATKDVPVWGDKDPSFDGFETAGNARWSDYSSHGKAVKRTNGYSFCTNSSCFYLPIKVNDEEWIMAMGTVLDDEGALIAESEPVFIRFERAGASFGTTSVLGGLKNGALQLPSSSESKIFGGAYSEGGEAVNVMAFMLDKGLGSYTRQDVVSMGDKAGLNTENTEYFPTDLQDRLDFLRRLYNKHQEAGGNQTARTGCSGLCFYEEGMNETGSQSLEGIHIVLNGEVKVGGNADIQGVLIVLNLDKDDSGKVELSELNASQWQVGLTTEMKLNGGGDKGTVWFDEAVVREALSRVSVSIDEFFSAGGAASSGRGVAVWR